MAVTRRDFLRSATAISVGALAGLRPARRAPLLVGLLVFTLLLAGAALIGTEWRYRFPLDPLINVLAAGGLVTPGGRVSLTGTYAELGRLAARNRHLDELTCFLGAGVYDHYVPASVWYLAGRGEFATSYTPYQPEMSQGVLQALFEYQTLISELTGLEISNASLYDGASAVAEAATMAVATTRRSELLVSAAVAPRVRELLDTYSQGLDIKLVEVSFPLSEDALRQGRVDSTNMVQPFAARAEAKGGIRKLFALEEAVPNIVHIVEACRKDFVDKNPELVKQYVKDITAALKMALANRDETMKVVSEITKAPVAVLDTYLLKGNDFAREPGAAPNFAGIQAMFDVYTNEKMIGKKLDAMQLKHPSIVAPLE